MDERREEKGRKRERERNNKNLSQRAGKKREGEVVVGDTKLGTSGLCTML
jgi:hypothetical protein